MSFSTFSRIAFFVAGSLRVSAVVATPKLWPPTSPRLPDGTGLGAGPSPPQPDAARARVKRPIERRDRRVTGGSCVRCKRDGEQGGTGLDGVEIGFPRDDRREDHPHSPIVSKAGS